MWGLSDIIAALQLAQDDIEKVHIIYQEEKAKKGNLIKAVDVNKRISKIINHKLVAYLRAMLQVSYVTYGNFARTTAKIIADNNEVVKKRGKQAKGRGFPRITFL